VPVRLETSSLSKMLLTWRATAFSLMNSACAMSRFALPAASRAKHRHFSITQASRGTGAAWRVDTFQTGFGVELLHRILCGVERETVPIPIAVLLAGGSHQDGGLRFLVRQLTSATHGN